MEHNAVCFIEDLDETAVVTIFDGARLRGEGFCILEMLARELGVEREAKKDLARYEIGGVGGFFVSKVRCQSSELSRTLWTISSIPFSLGVVFHSCNIPEESAVVSVSV